METLLDKMGNLRILLRWRFKP